MEKWKPINGFKGYEISSRGRVRSLTRRMNSAIKHNTSITLKGRVLRPNKKRNGYLQIGLTKNGKHYWTSVHRLVALHFLPRVENKSIVNHLNCDKADNRAENLEWCTQKENASHAVLNGLYRPSKFRKPIVCIELQRRFDSSYQAAKWLNETYYGFSKDPESMSRKIRAVATGKQLKAYGFRWRDDKVQLPSTTSP